MKGLHNCVFCRFKSMDNQYRRYRLFEKGRKRLAKETDVISLLQKVRGMERALDLKEQSLPQEGIQQETLSNDSDGYASTTRQPNSPQPEAQDKAVSNSS